MSGCEQLIGLRYRYGADGTDGEIDCIHLVLTALDRMGIERPAVNPRWYGGSRWLIVRALNAWGRRVQDPGYDGDVIVVPTAHTSWAFGVVWQTGILHVSQATERVNWLPLAALNGRFYRCCPTSAS